jgi:hypothetical protein
MLLHIVWAQQPSDGFVSGPIDSLYDLLIFGVPFQLSQLQYLAGGKLFVFPLRPMYRLQHNNNNK